VPPIPFANSPWLWSIRLSGAQLSRGVWKILQHSMRYLLGRGGAADPSTLLQQIGGADTCPAVPRARHRYLKRQEAADCGTKKMPTGILAAANALNFLQVRIN
jgi:hypothetical protein